MKNEVIKTQNEVDLDVLKKHFADNDRLLQLIRAVFFGFDMSKSEKKEVETAFSDASLVEAFRRKLYPQLSKDAPIETINDFWLEVERSVLGATPDHIRQHIEYKELLWEMLEQGMKRVQDTSLEPVDISVYGIGADPLQVKLIARNVYLRAVANALVQIKVVCNPAYAKEVIEKMQKMNSAK